MSAEEKPGNAEPQLGIGKNVANGKSAGNAEPQLGIGKNLANRPNAELGLGVPGVSGAPRGWYSRGYLPHYDSAQVVQFLTFRLADSLPQEKLRQLETELDHLPESDRAQERRKQIEIWLDSGLGCCALRHPKLATVMEDTLLAFDGKRYRLMAWCVMPNHVHVLIAPTAPLARIVQSWKSYTGRWALEKNAELGLGVPGKHFWMREYWDRYIRNENHFAQTLRYIHENPVKAGLCSEPQNWTWSSARLPGNAEPQLGNNRSQSDT